MDFAQKSFDPNAKGPLDGVRVLDMTRLVAGSCFLCSSRILGRR